MNMLYEEDNSRAREESRARAESRATARAVGSIVVDCAGEDIYLHKTSDNATLYTHWSGHWHGLRIELVEAPAGEVRMGYDGRPLPPKRYRAITIQVTGKGVDYVYYAAPGELKENAVRAAVEAALGQLGSLRFALAEVAAWKQAGR
jgi:hypothetical protein